MSHNLRCLKCGSMKFRKLTNWQHNYHIIAAPETRDYTCYECGQIVKVKTLQPEFQTVILGPNDKVLE